MTESNNILKRVEHYYSPTSDDDRPAVPYVRERTLGDLVFSQEVRNRIDDGWSGGERPAYVIYSQKFPSVSSIPDFGLFKNLKFNRDEAFPGDPSDMDSSAVFCHFCIPVGGYGALLALRCRHSFGIRTRRPNNNG